MYKALFDSAYSDRAGWSGKMDNNVCTFARQAFAKTKFTEIIDLLMR
jgi:hypothetical protein